MIIISNKDITGKENLIKAFKDWGQKKAKMYGLYNQESVPKIVEKEITFTIPEKKRGPLLFWGISGASLFCMITLSIAFPLMGYPNVIMILGINLIFLPFVILGIISYYIDKHLIAYGLLIIGPEGVLFSIPNTGGWAFSIGKEKPVEIYSWHEITEIKGIESSRAIELYTKNEKVGYFTWWSYSAHQIPNFEIFYDLFMKYWKKNRN